MNLLNLRKHFVKISGRYDLVGDTHEWVDNGADFYIQAGQDFLDRLRENPKATNTIFEELASGSWYLTFPRCRSIKEVWINNTSGRSRLTKKSMTELYRLYSGSIEETDTGTPLYYCPAKLRSTEHTDQNSLGNFFNYVLDSSDALRGILILAPPDESIVVELQGLFYSDALEADADESYWTINWPHLLVLAACRQVEVFNRNSAGVKDLTSSILAEIDGIDKDMIEEIITDFKQIEG